MARSNPQPSRRNVAASSPQQQQHPGAFTKSARRAAVAAKLGGGGTSWRQRVLQWLRGMTLVMVAVLVAAALVGCVMYMYVVPMLHVGCGYAAKTVCSGVFVSGRSLEHLWLWELGVSPLLPLVSVSIDRTTQRVRVAMFGGVLQAEAMHHGAHLGCSLLTSASRVPLSFNRTWSESGVDLEEEAAAWLGVEDSEWLTNEELVPERERLDLDAVRRVVAREFDRSQMPASCHTRAIVVAHAGKVVAEQYDDGIDRHTPLLGWSMTKSLLSTLIGMRIADGELALNDTVHHAAWNCDAASVVARSRSRQRTLMAAAPASATAAGLVRTRDDALCRVTVEQLLRMNSGLPFDEAYTPTGDPTRMLFSEHSTAEFAAQRALEQPHEGTRWHYSSGSTNLLSHVLQSTFSSQRDYLSYPLRLFRALGLRSAVIEVDPAGTFVGSSFSYMSARDWARFGLLYLNDGMWLGRRILPANWLKVTTKPTAGSHGLYGAHWWLNMFAGATATKRPPTHDVWGKFAWLAALPHDAFFAAGHEGQLVMVIPSRELVVVRLGFNTDETAWDRVRFFTDLLREIPAAPA